MKKISLSSIFTTTPRYTRTIDRHTNLGISNKILSHSKLVTSLRSKRLLSRTISHEPNKILDAPGVIDDFYMNILDWSYTNKVSIALGDTLYQYDYNTKNVNKLLQLNTSITGIKSRGVQKEMVKSSVFSDEQNMHIDKICNFDAKKHNITNQAQNESTTIQNDAIAVGTADGHLVVIENNIGVIKYKADDTRICAIDWNDKIVSFGTKSGNVIHFDTRSGKEICKIQAHESEVCGLKWSNDKKYLATGSNDNTLKIWQTGNIIPRMNLQAHKSAIKALAWCPWKNGILATGGGTKDKSIKIWDVYKQELISSTNVNSQICAIIYSEKYKEIITSHGYSENSINLWKASTMQHINTFGKHESRVLHITSNSDGSMIASVSADENLKFWTVYDKNRIETKPVHNFR
ncbi:ubiquitin-protein transferase activating protein [Binucleata daphniae]